MGYVYNFQRLSEDKKLDPPNQLIKVIEELAEYTDELVAYGFEPRNIYQAVELCDTIHAAEELLCKYDSDVIDIALEVVELKNECRGYYGNDEQSSVQIGGTHDEPACDEVCDTDCPWFNESSQLFFGCNRFHSETFDEIFDKTIDDYRFNRYGRCELHDEK